jgi:endonuclease YncB( thermonuclease family)
MHKKPFSIKGFLILDLLAGLITFFLTSLSFAREPIRTVTGTVTKVSDGDTIQVTTPEQIKFRVRIYGIDAPETPKINQRTGHINQPGQNPMEKNPGKPWKAKSWGSRSDWTSWTLTGINAWWERSGSPTGIST